MSITVTRDLSQPMRQVVRLRNPEFAVDGGPAEGGGDAGPDLHDLYDAAISACKALTLVGYAGRKEIPLTDVRTVTEGDNSEERKRVYRLHTVLHLSAHLREDQRHDLLAVAEKCPVHKLMTTVTTHTTTSLA